MSKLSALQAKFKAKLEGGQFRFINERLYTQTGAESLSMMKSDPTCFTDYHCGYRSQVEGWPANPLDVMIEEVKKAPTAVVADFGCGEARLAASVPNKVHSFDLVAANPRITACNIAHVPIADQSADIAIFCLSLMGTDYLTFLQEARRVLRAGGRLLIAEVRSRFVDAEGAEGGAVGGGGGGARAGAGAGDKRKRYDSATAQSPGLSAFIAAVKRLGFNSDRVDDTNRMFVLMFFKKTAESAPPLAGATPSTLPATSSGSGSAAKRPRTDQADVGPSGRPRSEPHKGGKFCDTARGKALSERGGRGGKRGGGGGGRDSFSSQRPSAPPGPGASSSGPVLKACVYKKR